MTTRNEAQQGNLTEQVLTEADAAIEKAEMTLLPNPMGYYERFVFACQENEDYREILDRYNSHDTIDEGGMKKDEIRTACVKMCSDIALVMDDTDVSLINTIFSYCNFKPSFWNEPIGGNKHSFGYDVIESATSLINILSRPDIQCNNEQQIKTKIVDGIVTPLDSDDMDNLDLTPMITAEEKDPEWLVEGYIPRYQITSLAGNGGSGKTTVWCSIAAAISAGTKPFLLNGQFPPAPYKADPQRVLFFSAEDSFEYTLKRRLRKNGARLENIFSIDIADDRFQKVKFNNHFLERLIERYRPALVIFDPIQAFIPPNINMAYRNAMRGCLAPLVGFGEKYGATFLIVEHSNKMAGVWGRKRIADSADIWDISRSVILAGETEENDIRYLSHEKSNYSMTAETVLYTLDDEIVRFYGTSVKKDRDFVLEETFTTKQAPARDEARDFILDSLQDGEMEVKELDGLANAMGLSKNAMRNTKSALKNEGQIKYRSEGFKPKIYFISRVGLSMQKNKPTSTMQT